MGICDLAKIHSICVGLKRLVVALIDHSINGATSHTSDSPIPAEVKLGEEQAKAGSRRHRQVTDMSVKDSMDVCCQVDSLTSQRSGQLMGTEHFR